ncbi:MAG: hypothetical protein LUC97_05590 [Clostridiales bacterium]|nr:hypothetical protein [Clostridiales bacterium]
MESVKFKTITQCDWYDVFSKEELILILSKLPDYYGVAASVLIDKAEKANEDMCAALDRFKNSPTPENWRSRKITFNRYSKLNDLLSKVIISRPEE